MNHTIFFLKNVVPKLHVTCLPLQVFCVSLITMKDLGWFFLSIIISKVQYIFFFNFSANVQKYKKKNKEKTLPLSHYMLVFFKSILTPLSNNQMNWYLYYYNTILGRDRENILFSLKHFWIDWIPAFHNVLGNYDFWTNPFYSN